MTETCVMCCTAQPISAMRRDGAAWECADEIACLARRHDLITVMQRGLDQAWRVLDDLAAAEEQPAGQTPGSDCGGVRGSAPSPGQFLRAQFWASVARANGGATAIHRLFIPAIRNLKGLTCMYRPDLWVPWSAEVRQP